MKPKFRRDVTYYRQDNGVAFHREGRWFQLDGPGLFEALERLTPRLDGTRELAELVAGMPPAAEQKLRRLIQILHKTACWSTRLTNCRIRFRRRSSWPSRITDCP